MVDGSNIIEAIGTIMAAATTGAGATVVAMYKFFVPKGEATEYRVGVEIHRKSMHERMDNFEASLSKAVTRERLDDVIGPIKGDLDANRKAMHKRMDNVEFALSKTVTRETLDDVMGPMKDDLKEIKLLLRERR